MSKLITHIKRLALTLCLATPIVSWAATSTYSTYKDDTDTPRSSAFGNAGYQRFKLNATWMFNVDGTDIASTADAVSLDSIKVYWHSGSHGNADIGHGSNEPDPYLVVTTPQKVIVGISAVGEKWSASGSSTFAFTDLTISPNAQYYYYFATDVSGLEVGGVLSGNGAQARFTGTWHGSAKTSDTTVCVMDDGRYSIRCDFAVSEATSTVLTTTTEGVSLTTGTDPVFVKGAVADGVVNVGPGVEIPSLTVVGEATTLKLAGTLTATYLYLPATTTIDASSVEIGLPGSSEGTKETVLVVGKIAAGSDPTVTLPDLDEGYSYEPLVRDDSGIKAVVSRPVDATVTFTSGGQQIKWSEVKPEGWVDSALPTITIDNANFAGTLVFDENVQAAKIIISGAWPVNIKRNSGVSVSIPQFTASAYYMTHTFTDFEAIPATTHATETGDALSVVGTETLTSIPQISTANQQVTLTIAQKATLSGTGDGDGFYVRGTKSVNINSGADISATRFVLGNNGGTTQTVTQNGGAVTVTGTAAPTSNQASILLGHWNSTVTLKTLGGTFTANNVASRLGWDGTATWQIGGGSSAAQVNVYGIVNGGNGHSGAGTLNIMANGTLNLGAGGVDFSNSGNGGNINLAGGTISAGATEVSIINAKDAGTIINQGTTTTVSVGEGNTMTINAVLSGVGAGTLKKTGAGKLVLAKSGTTNGNLSITEGTAEFNDDVVWTSGSGSVSISEGATLNVLKTEEAAEGELLIAGKFTVNGTVQQNGTQVDVDVRNDGIYIAVPTVTITVPNVDNATVVVSDGASTYGPTTEGGTSYVVPEGATITATYTANSGYSFDGATRSFELSEVKDGDAVTVGELVAKAYVASIVDGVSYTSLQAAFNATAQTNSKVVLLANEEDGATVPSVNGKSFYFYAGEFTHGTIANAEGNFITTVTEQQIQIGDEDVTATKYRVESAFMAVTISETRTLYGMASANDALAVANAGPIGTTVEFFSGDPASYAAYLPMFTYNEQTGIYTKTLEPVAAVYSGVQQLSVHTTLADAIAAAEAGQTVKLLADYTNESGEAVVFDKAYAVTLDLNGYTLTGTDGIRMNAAGPLTVTDTSASGTGKVIATASDGVALWARNGSAIVNAGTFQNNSISEATVYVGYKDAPQYDNQTVIINGGTFVNLAQAYKYDTSGNGTYSYYALNVLNTFPVAAIQVSAGSFSYDPAKGDDNQGGTFVKSGYASTETSTGVWTVTEVTNPTIDGQPVDPAAVFDTATSAKGITYPTAPTVSGEAGSQTITYKDTEVNVPAYYTASLSGTTVTLTLNSNALPTVGATEASGDDEAVPATEVTDETFGLGLTTTSAKLYYGLATCDTPSGTFADPTTLTKGTGKAMSLTATRGENETVKFYKVFVTDIAPVTP